MNPARDLQQQLPMHTLPPLGSVLRGASGSLSSTTDAPSAPHATSSSGVSGGPGGAGGRRGQGRKGGNASGLRAFSSRNVLQRTRDPHPALTTVLDGGGGSTTGSAPLPPQSLTQQDGGSFCPGRHSSYAGGDGGGTLSGNDLFRRSLSDIASVSSSSNGGGSRKSVSSDSSGTNRKASLGQRDDDPMADLDPMDLGNASDQLETRHEGRQHTTDGSHQKAILRQISQASFPGPPAVTATCTGRPLTASMTLLPDRSHGEMVAPPSSDMALQTPFRSDIFLAAPLTTADAPDDNDAPHRDPKASHPKTIVAPPRPNTTLARGSYASSSAAGDRLLALRRRRPVAMYMAPPVSADVSSREAFEESNRVLAGQDIPGTCVIPILFRTLFRI